jgi:hypothetical protein
MTKIIERVKSYVDCAVPVLSSRVLDETVWRFYCADTSSVGNDELVKLWQKMTGPSVGGVNNGPGTKTASSRLDMDPTILITVAHFDYRCICMQRQVARLQQDTEQSMDKLVRPSAYGQTIHIQKVWGLTLGR